ncbi:hypothetical protein ACFL59_13920, partial [Planctomycetota bacterium]
AKGGSTARRRTAVAAPVLAAFVTVVVGTGIYAVLMLMAQPDGSNPLEQHSGATHLADLAPEDAYRKGVKAYLRGELTEALRRLRIASGPSVREIADLVAAELADLKQGPDFVSEITRKQILRRVLQSDPPGPIREHCRAQLNALEDREKSRTGNPD